MSPRPYKSNERQAAAQVTRERIIAATRALLSEPAGIAAFSLEAVAKRASVARMTVYYQFGSRRGLLEALYDNLGQASLVPRLRAVFTSDEPIETLARLLDAFSGFWAAEQLITRRLRALARLDAEVEAGIAERDRWRRGLLHNALERAAATNPRVAAALLDPHTEDAIFGLMSFEFFDVLAGQAGPEAAAAIVRDLVMRELGLAE